LVVKDVSDKELENTQSLNKYYAFLKELRKSVYQELYNEKFNFHSFKINQLKENDLPNLNKNDLMTFDMLNPETIKLAISISEALDRTTDDEITNSIVLASHNFFSPINWLLSPAALAISFFNFQLLSLQKQHKDEKYYSKTSLPRTTYLSLTGLYSEIDIDVLSEFSENIQIIVLYDESTGPSFIQKGEFEPEKSLRSKKRHFQQISNKILLIPVKCSSARRKNGKMYSPNDILTIIENLVIPSIEKFKPSSIVINSSFIFEEGNSTPFFIDGQTMSCIISFLKILCDNKILVFPFKLPNLNEQNVKNLFEKTMDFLPSDEHRERFSSILTKYGVPYDELHFKECFCNVFETLADLKETPSIAERTGLRKIYGASPLVNEVCYRVARAYKEHPYYSILYSKDLGFLARISQKEANFQKFPLDSEKQLINTIPVYCPENDVRILKLHIPGDSGNETKEIVLDKNSQYFIDYESNEYAHLYIFNAKLCELSNDLGLRTYTPLSHFYITLEYEEMVKNYSVSDDFVQLSSNYLHNFEKLKNSGICKCENYIFQVYGTNIENNKASTDIYCYDFKQEQCFKLQVALDTHGIMPRHSVTTCAFKKDGTYYLYVFGGSIDTKTNYRGTEFGCLDIIDIVEVYETQDPTGEWRHKVCDKHSFVDEKKFQFIPYHGSFAHYLPNKNKIVIMGGKTFEGSVSNWTFPVFELDVSTNTFTSFQIFLNDLKNNPHRKEIKNHAYNRLSIPVAIGDINKNVYFHKKDGSFRFVIPHKEDEFVSIYSYNLEKQISEHFQIQVEKEGKSIMISPPNLNKESSSKKFENKHEPLDTRTGVNISYSLNSLPDLKALLSLANWRLFHKEQVLTNVKVEDHIKSLIDKNQAFSEEYKKGKYREEDFEIKAFVVDFDSPDERTKGFENILKLCKAKKFSEVLEKKDSRLEVLKGQVQSEILSQPEFIQRIKNYNYDLKAHFDFESLLKGMKQNLLEDSQVWSFESFLENVEESKKEIFSIFEYSKQVLEDWMLIHQQDNDDSFEGKLSVHIFIPQKEDPEKRKNIDKVIKEIEILTGKMHDKSLQFSGAPSKDHSWSKSTADQSTRTSSDVSSILGLKAATFIDEFLLRLKSLFQIYQMQLNHAQNFGGILVRPFEITLKSVYESLKELLKNGNEIVHKTQSTNETGFDSSTTEITLKTEKIKQDLKSDEELTKKRIIESPSKLPKQVEESEKTEIFYPENNQYRLKNESPVFQREEVRRSKEIEEEKEKEKEKEKMEDDSEKQVQNFKQAICKNNNYRMTFNRSRSELNVIFNEDSGKMIHKRLRFKVQLMNKKTKRIDLEDISFESCPSAISIFNMAAVCYVEQSLKVRYTDVYNSYKSWILYANLEEAIELLKTSEMDFEYIVFRKLFQIAQDEHIFDRSLLLTEESLFLFGGKSHRFKGKGKPTVRHHKEISNYIFKKFVDVNQISSEFRDSEVDDLENVKGELVSIYDGKHIFIVPRINPSVVEIFNQDGTLEDHVTLNFSDEENNYFVKLNLVNFREREEILFILSCQEQSFKFQLFDIENKSFEKGKVTLVLQNEEQDKFKQIATNFEEFEITSGPNGSQDIILFSTRGDEPETLLYKIMIQS